MPLKLLPDFIGVCIMSEKINPINNFYCPRNFSLAGPDEEHIRIMRKLMAYGYTPTGKKNADYELLRKIELKLAKLENCVCSKFLTVTKTEQEKIQEKKKEKKLKKNPEASLNTMKGQKILGEQIMLAIQMKKDIEKRRSKKD